ncbi:hypothetical protein [Escherichia coli]|uniref:hypothetical protein n=1 Tax=Escherichia coli TaxID=562 RepID=UPI00197AF98A|nr:hypothetical protein [Escherichia coli]
MAGGQQWYPVHQCIRGCVCVPGTAREVELVRQLLPQIDVRAQEVSVAGYVFEVQTSERNGSGLALAAELLSGRFSITMSSASGWITLFASARVC